MRALIAESGFALPPNALNGAEWRLMDEATAARMRRMEKSGVPLGEYVKGKIYYGIKTGLNEVKIGSDGNVYGKSLPNDVSVVRREGVFVIDGAKRAALIAEDPKSAEIIKPLAVGDDVRKWRIRKRDVWLIFTRRGVDLDRYPAIKRHLSQWRKELEPRPRDWDTKKQGEWPGRKPGSYKWFEIQDDIAYYAEFDKPKIVYSEISKEPRFTLDNEGTYLSNTAYLIGSAEQFLLAVLNSGSAWSYLATTASVLGDEEAGGRIRVIRQFAERIPIPRASDADRAAIEALVQQILDLKAADPNADVSEWEAEIDKRVEFLYFHQDEAPTYDAWLAQREAEQGTFAGEVRDMIAQGESNDLEFKETLEYVDRPPAGLAGDALNQWRARKQAERVHEVLKTVCGYLNGNGGTLLLGVHDDHTIIGIEPDYRLISSDKDRSPDGFERKLRDLCDRRFNRRPIGLVSIRFASLDGKTICRVDVSPDPEAFYLDGDYWVRDGNRTITLLDDERDVWIAKRRAK